MGNEVNFYNSLAKGLADINIKVDVASDGFFSHISLDKDYTNALFDDLAEKVSDEVITYKETMLPFVDILSNDVKKYMEKNMKHINRSPIKLSDVSMSSLTEILYETGMLNKDINYDNNIVGNGASIPEPDLNKVLTFSTPTVANAVNALTIGKGKDYLSKLWDKYFANIDINNEAINRINFLPITKLDEYTLVYLICNQILSDNTLLGNITNSTPKYLQAISKLKGGIGNGINKGIADLEYKIKQDYLIIHISGDTVYLNASIYDDFTKEYKVEAILGLAKSKDKDNPRLYKTQSVIENNGKYISIWNKYLHIENQKTNTENTIVYRKAYLNTLMNLVKNELSDDVKELTEYDNIDSIRILEKYLHIHLLSLSSAELMDITAMSQKLVSEYLFATSNLGNYIKYMNNVLSINKEMKPDEAAIYATGELIISYLITQIRLIKV